MTERKQTASLIAKRHGKLKDRELKSQGFLIRRTEPV